MNILSHVETHLSNDAQESPRQLYLPFVNNTCSLSHSPLFMFGFLVVTNQTDEALPDDDIDASNIGGRTTTIVYPPAATTDQYTTNNNNHTMSLKLPTVRKQLSDMSLKGKPTTTTPATKVAAPGAANTKTSMQSPVGRRSIVAPSNGIRKLEPMKRTTPVPKKIIANQEKIDLEISGSYAKDSYQAETTTVS